MTIARDKANSTVTNFASTGIDDNASSTAVTIDSSSNVGIGTDSPSTLMHLKQTTGNAILRINSDSGERRIDFGDSTDDDGGRIKYDGSDNMLLFTDGTERMRITSSGKLSINGTGDVAGSLLTVHGSSRYIGVKGGSETLFGDTGSSGFMGTFSNHAMAFRTNNTDRLTIDTSGNVLVGRTNIYASTATSGGGSVLNADGLIEATKNGVIAMLNRNTTDGSIIELRQDGVTEGTISVSGTTVSYNGGHLSRWSRLTDDSKDMSIVKGTVMTNLDAMVEWGDEENEQLNKMAVSSVEGDANVAGVFVNWDNDDDDFNDMNIAMTGDMVIRIAQGTTVQRGDLLMSAGDGTAKPQGDDIVRSKTIAKVTSTHVSHTYDDGSYLVPCVLMAC